MNVVFNELCTILANQFCFHSDQLQKETKLELELGMDSREMLELLSVIEICFKINLDLDDIDWLIERQKLITIEDLINYIEKKQLSNFNRSQNIR